MQWELKLWWALSVKRMFMHIAWDTFFFFLDFTAYNKLILDFNIFQKTYVINLPYAYLGDFLKPIALASIFFKEIL